MCATCQGEWCGLCIESGREIQEGEACDRPFSHIKEKIILNIQDTFIGMLLSVSRMKTGHKASFVNVGLKIDSYYPFKRLGGKHIAMKKPKKSVSEFYNYNFMFSLVLLALVNADYRFP